ncbi:MAG: type IV pilus secretin PilQ [Paludibacterium sp.]|uniref:type IV pilus secretin PilQ n=1 Tax=Paludibacterium sp. TaxID=1917523 RepID=UPI0025E6864E|nr:type IV pilus secretin PilQ [Paludibacterium sp.]MBV8046672.1 type IV pilus secretin PilQ [Paludibacterium sp.]MBV8649583.1 type IV pilus secretin PilQ [Paludibacterium sp.]
MTPSRPIGILRLSLSLLATAATAEETKTLSLNLQNMDVRAALYALADFAGKDMIVNDSVQGQISLRLNEIPWDQAIDLIVQTKGLEKQMIGNVMHIAKQETLLGRDKQSFEAGQQRKAMTAALLHPFPLRHRPVAEIRQLLEEGRWFSDKGGVLADPVSNTLFVHDTPENGARIRQFIELADRPQHQVMIEARIVEANDFFSRELGSKLHFARMPTARPGQGADGEVIGWRGNAQRHGETDTYGLPIGVNLPVQTAFGSIAALFRAGASTLISLELQAMQAEGQGKVISSPRLLTADRSEATIEEGHELPYPRASSRGRLSVDFKKTALSLKVKPVVAPDARSLWLDIEISKDSPNFKQLVNDAPSVDTKRIRTRVHIENGGTVVLGGIYIDEQHHQYHRVPLLGDIPILGALFSRQSKRHQRRELLVFITPQIVSRA